jgi:hypothetical protein
MAWTTPRTWTPGELVTALMMNQHVRDNLNDLNGRAGVAYTPTWGNSGSANTLGNGTLAGLSWRMGQLVFFRISFVFGSTSASGSGSWTFTFPFTSDGFAVVAGIWGIAKDNSANLHYPMTALNNSTTVFQPVNHVSPVTAVTATTPFTWADQDFLALAGIIIVP